MSSIKLSGCAIMKDGSILLIRKKDRDFWELPGGVVKEKDAEEQTAIDKTNSQIGIEPTIVQHFTILEYQKDAKNIEATIYECDIDPEAEPAPGENIDEVKWFKISELPKENIGNDVKEILEELQ